MDRNLGADPLPFDPSSATGNTDTGLYGDLFQWGRGDDGHQVVDWTESPPNVTPTTSTLSIEEDVPGHSDFITNNTSPHDWRDPQNNNLWQSVDGINNLCPPGWRVPTEDELDAELENWDPANDEGAFASDLKWPVGGYRRHSNGQLSITGGRIWSSSVDGGNAVYLLFDSFDNTGMKSLGLRAVVMSVRCVRDIVRTEDE